MDFNSIMNYKRMESLMVILPLSNEILSNQIKKKEKTYKGAVKFLEYIESFPEGTIDTSGSFMVRVSDLSEEQLNEIRDMDPREVEEKYTNVDRKSIGEIASRARSIVKAYEEIKSSLDDSKRFYTVLSTIRDYIDDTKQGDRDEKIREIFGENITEVAEDKSISSSQKPQA